MQTATNPKTGERVTLIDGEWVKTATNPKTGEKAIFKGGKWNPVPLKNPLGPAYSFLQGGLDLPNNLMRFMARLDADPEKIANIEAQNKRRTENVEDDGFRLAGGIVGGGIAGAPRAAGVGALGNVAERVGNAALEAGMFGAMSTDLDAKKAAGIGAGLAGTMEGIGAAIQGGKGVPGAVGRGIAKLLPMSEDARKADVFAEARKIPIAGEDLIQNQIVRSTGRVLDAADPTNFRNRQLSSMEDAFQREMLDPFSDFENPLAEMGESFKRQYKSVLDQKNDLYQKAFTELNAKGAVPMHDMRQSLSGLREDYIRKFGDGSKEVGEIDRWLGYGDATIEDWHDRMKDVSRRLRQAERSADPDTVSTALLGDIKTLVMKSINDFGGENNSWNRANSFYRERVVPYKQDAFMRQIRKGNTEKAVNDALSGAPTAQTEQRFKQAWGALDEQGRDAYRQQLLQSVMDAGRNPETGFSPSAAATRMDRVKNRLGEQVLGTELTKAMDGWNNLFRQSGFAAEQVARSRTGSSIPQMAGPAVALLAGSVQPMLLATVLPGLMVRSRKVRQMLAKLSEMKPNHPDYNSVVQDVMAEAGREAARIQAIAE